MNVNPIIQNLVDDALYLEQVRRTVVRDGDNFEDAIDTFEHVVDNEMIDFRRVQVGLGDQLSLAVETAASRLMRSKRVCGNLCNALRTEIQEASAIDGEINQNLVRGVQPFHALALAEVGRAEGLVPMATPMIVRLERLHRAIFVVQSN